MPEANTCEWRLSCCERHHFPCLCRWRDLPIALRFFRRHNLAVGVIEHLRGHMSKLVRDAGRISDSRQPVACETVTAPIDGPAQETGNLTHSINLATRSGGDNMPLHSRVRSQPRGEIRLYRNDSPSRTFGLCGFHVDV